MSKEMTEHEICELIRYKGVVMTERQVCESIVKQGNCYSIKCMKDHGSGREADCPFTYPGDGIRCTNRVESAIQWLKDHKEQNMSKVTDYKIIEAKCAKDLEIEVNRLIKAGWNVWGNLMYTSATPRWLQAMVYCSEKEGMK